ncbi:MAG: asparagine--tRNA ligase [Spirochaetales bacterium]
MQPRMRVREALQKDPSDQEIELAGWVRTRREAKSVVFLEINDGSCLSNIQITIDQENASLVDAAATATTGSSIHARGTLVESMGKNQRVEFAASSLEVLGTAPGETYPMQKKRHSFEFLREIAHLRPRTNTFGAVARVRNFLSFAIHRFFQEREFLYVHTPIITASDAEGAGELFQVTTLDLEGLARSTPSDEPAVDYARDFFGKPAYLTVSGQLNAEIYASALERVYTFGPTFRAENSNTTRHLAEFWMIEPEIAFCDIDGNMDLAEDFLKTVIRGLLTECEEDMAFFDLRIQKGLVDGLRTVAESSFKRVTYTEAVEALEKSGRGFEYPVRWGKDLQSEHEKFLTEEVYQGPVIVTDYPKDIKAFYMKQNDDGKTVRGMDVLVPRLGEIIGGSQREENLEALERRIVELDLDREAYWWYLDLRRFGTVPHSGFGLGFERFVQYCTGMQNIRDVIPFPRTPGSALF